MAWSDDEDDFNPPPYDPFGLLPQSDQGPEGTPAPTPRSGHRFVSDTHWGAARDAYLDGESAASISARFGMGERTIRARAQAEGWRRADQVEVIRPIVDDADEADQEALADASYTVLAERALVQLRRAMARDRAVDAGRWMRVHRRLVDLAEAEDRARAAAEAKAAKATEPERFTHIWQAKQAEQVILNQREADAYVASSAVLNAALSARLGPPDLHGPDFLQGLHGLDPLFSADP